jgi:hypothetical protein
MFPLVDPFFRVRARQTSVSLPAGKAGLRRPTVLARERL